MVLKAGSAYLAGANGGAKSIELIENGVFDGAGASSLFSPQWHPFDAHWQDPPQQVIIWAV